MAKDVIIAGPYGRLTAQHNQVFNSFTTYANGTMFFNVTGQEDRQGYYQYTVESYGNGTMLILFSGVQPIEITAQRAASTVNAALNRYEVRYTVDVDDQLCIAYVRGQCTGAGGAILGFILDYFDLILILGAVFVAVTVIGRDIRKHGWRRDS